MFKTGALAVGLLGILLVMAVSDFVLFWWETCYGDNEIVNQVRRRTQKGPGIHEELPDGSIRVRRFLNQEPRFDQISGRQIQITTNALGYRDAYIGPKPEGEYRIVVLGDSCTFAGYLEVHETYPHMIERMLNAEISHGPYVRVINAGVTGISLKDELNILVETGLLVQPDMVLVGTSQNDSSASIFFPEDRGALSRSRLAQKWRDLHFYGDIEGKTEQLYEKWTGKPLPVDSYPDGAWKSDPDAFETEVARNVVGWGAGWFPQPWQEMKPDFEAIHNLGIKYGFETVVFLFPITVQVEAEQLHDRPQRYFKDAMQELGVKHIDPLNALRMARQGRNESLFFDHGHLIPDGNRIIARLIVDFLLTDTGLAKWKSPRRPLRTLSKG